jgi:hypothetical protein
MLQPLEKKLLNIEQFFIDNSFKSRIKNLGKFGHAFDITEKPLVNKIY